MNTIYKFPLAPPGVSLDLQLPIAARPLCVHMQNGQPYLWVQLNTSLAARTRTFVLIGTGHRVPDRSDYIGTVLSGPFVWHLFEVRE